MNNNIKVQRDNHSFASPIISSKIPHKPDPLVEKSDEIGRNLLGNLAHEIKAGEEGKYRLLEVQKPVGIPNTGNSCYRNASNQALFAIPYFRNLVKTPLEQNFVELDEDFEIRESLRQVLEALFSALESGEDQEIIREREELLRDMIIESNLGGTEITSDQAYRQQDAASYLEIVLNKLIKYKLWGKQTLEHRAGENIHRSATSVDFGAIIPISLLENVEDLQSLVDLNYSKTYVDAPWREFKNYFNETKIEGKPKDALIFQLKRGGSKKELAVHGGLVDFSSAYNLEKGCLIYGVKCFIMHEGTVHGGHYTSYVNKNGQWYHCDDKTVTFVSKSTALQEMKKAYFLFLEKKT